MGWGNWVAVVQNVRWGDGFGLSLCERSGLLVYLFKVGGLFGCGGFVWLVDLACGSVIPRPCISLMNAI